MGALLMPGLERRLRAEVTGDVLFDRFSRGRYATDASHYQMMPIGVVVTLRGERMYEFFDRLVSIALPRVRDFRGVSPKAFDGRGNYTIGVREQLIFPEIDFNKVDKLRGMNICIVTTARDDDQARSLLKAMGMPFRT